MDIGLLLGVGSAFAVPLAFCTFGWLFTHGRYPKHPNDIYGYRTTRAMKNDETWAFAQELWGRVSWRFGICMFVFSSAFTALLWVLTYRQFMSCLCGLVVIESLLSLATIIPVERALKKSFDEYGRKTA